jgi:hypothetical protein
MLLAGCIPGGKQRPVLVTRKFNVASEFQVINPKKITSGRNVTIWIHGTKTTSLKLPFKRIRQFFDCQPGLNPSNLLDENYHMRTIAKTISNSDSDRFPEEDFYLFGWSGQLSFEAREQAAEELYTALIKLLVQYTHRDSHMPSLRIITHSHGGNVALLLAEIMEKRQQYFPIDELILLACPVQDRTANLPGSHIFKKVYSIYSAGDLFQIGDPQGAYKNVPAETFLSRRHFPPQENLRQAIVKFNRRSLMHIEFILPRFLTLLPDILDEIDAWYTNIQSFMKNSHEMSLLLVIDSKTSKK